MTETAWEYFQPCKNDNLGTLLLTASHQKEALLIGETQDISSVDAQQNEL